jgi:signal transduction histidine kinase
MIDETLIIKGAICELEGQTFEVEETIVEGKRIYIFMNVTEEKALEKKVEETSYFKKWEAYYREVLHEIKTPLGTIRNYLYLVTEEMKKHGGGRRKSDVALENLKAIHGETLRIDSIIEAIGSLDFENNAGLGNSDICEELRFMGTIYDKIFQSRGTSFSLRIPSDRVIISLPPSAARQIFSNLVVNAIEASGEGDDVWVEVKEEDGGTTIEIFNSGKELEDQLIPHLFEGPLHSTKGDKGGLGLWITGRLVNKHGGRITYEKVNGGSLFKVHFDRISGGEGEEDNSPHS